MGLFDNKLINTALNNLIQGPGQYANGKDGDVILSSKKNSLLFPIPPPSFSISTSTNNQTVSVQSVGEVTVKGLRNAYSISFNSFFPGSDSYEYAGMALAPYDYVEIIEAMRDDLSPCHLSILGTNVDMDVLIDSFEYSEKNGVGDIEFTLSFTEYRVPTESMETTIKSSTGLRNRRSLADGLKKNVKIRSGDSLGSILKRAVLNTQAQDIKQEELAYLRDLKALVKGNIPPKVGDSVASGFSKRRGEEP